jgi:prepilin-type processing-associated H-X9-DG protein
MPMVFDSRSSMNYGTMDDPPPYRDVDPSVHYSANVCIDRHTGGINVAFMDFSVRKVSLKRLWALKWHREYDTAGPWTPAGGVQPQDWPPWMHHCED